MKTKKLCNFLLIIIVSVFAFEIIRCCWVDLNNNEYSSTQMKTFRDRVHLQIHTGENFDFLFTYDLWMYQCRLRLCKNILNVHLTVIYNTTFLIANCLFLPAHRGVKNSLRASLDQSFAFGNQLYIFLSVFESNLCRIWKKILRAVGQIFYPSKFR